jgi:hypothetical protein
MGKRFIVFSLLEAEAYDKVNTKDITDVITLTVLSNVMSFHLLRLSRQ